MDPEAAAKRDDHQAALVLAKKEEALRRAGGEEDANGIGEGGKAAGGDQVDDAGLFGGRVSGGASKGVGHIEALQDGEGTIHAGAAGDLGLVERRGQQGRIGKAGQSLAPGLLVRRIDDDAIDVEYNSLDRLQVSHGSDDTAIGGRAGRMDRRGRLGQNGQQRGAKGRLLCRSSIPIAI